MVQESPRTLRDAVTLRGIIRRAAALVAAAGIAAGCAPRDYYRTSSSALDSLLVSQKEMLRRVNAVDRKVETTRSEVQASRASTDTRLSELGQRIDVIEGKLEDSGVRFTRLAEKVDTVKQRISARDSLNALAMPGSLGVAVNVDPEAMYQAAYSDVAAGRYDLARQAFEEYLRQFPDTEVSDNAKYWIGECYYAQGDFATAVAAFEEVPKRYPDGDKVPAALLKSGITHARLKNIDEARRYYRLVIDKYPRSAEAARAKELLGTR